MTNQQIANISGYQFTSLNDLNALLTTLESYCQNLSVKGTIYLSYEGIKINLAGPIAAIDAFVDFINNDEFFPQLSFHQSFSDTIPFKKLIIKQKPELITTRADFKADLCKKSHIQPRVLQDWLDAGKDIQLLDTRNDYEYRLGTFVNAKTLPMKCFTEFNDFIDNAKGLDRNKPTVIFCTGGIRCEKALPMMQASGFKEVYQLEGGILSYLRQFGAKHYQGECFVFDNRISLDAQCQQTHKRWCQTCQQPLTVDESDVNMQKTFCYSCENQLN
ncbi:MAG: rhodanese-like domain-containing protein [Pseudomonadota bacterium]